jgi:MinD superfamily P-loop ATPase
VVSCLRDGAPDGAVIVTTPQEMALADVRKEINFCRKVGMPILGLVENMGPYTCTACGGESSVFAPAGGDAGPAGVARAFGIPFLGTVPLDPRIAMCCDAGESFVEEFPEAPAAKAYADIVQRIRDLCEKDADGKMES